MMSWAAQTHLAGHVFETPGLTNNNNLELPLGVILALHKLPAAIRVDTKSNNQVTLFMFSKLSAK